MRQRPSQLRPLIAIAAVLLMAASAGGLAAETLNGGRYAVPVERYGHFALGRPHEYAVLEAMTSAGRTVTARLPGDAVFEDRSPRLIRLRPGGAPMLLTIVSARESGARLVLYRLHGGRLEVRAQSAPIGRPMRWLNPVGAADLDGDGSVEIAAVITPHIGGTLKVYRLRGQRLAEIAALDGFSNHVYGSAELRLSLATAVDGRQRLVVPGSDRRSLRVIALRGSSLVEVGRCHFGVPVTGPVTELAPARLAVTFSDGEQRIDVRHCLRSAE